MLSQDINQWSLRQRRIASAAMLSAIGVFMAAATIDNLPSQPQSSSENMQFEAMRPRATMSAFQSGIPGPPMLLNQEIQLLDPRQHPADLPAKESALTLFNIMEPQSRYNNVTFTSFTSVGNQLVSSR